MTDVLVGVGLLCAGAAFAAFGWWRYRRAQVSAGWAVFTMFLGVPGMLIVLAIGVANQGPLIGTAAALGMAGAILTISSKRFSDRKYFQRKADEYMRRGYPELRTPRKGPRK